MRRKFFGFALSAMLFALCLSVEAQQPGKVYRIGYLSSNLESNRREAFRQGLRDLGYIEGQNIIIEYRIAEGKRDKLPDLVAELIRLEVDVIFAFSGTAIQAAKKATSTVPRSCCQLGAARWEHYRVSQPNARARWKTLGTAQRDRSPSIPCCLLWERRDTFDSDSALRMKETQSAAPSLGIKLQSIEVRGVNDFEPAFSAMKKDRAGALVPLRGTLINNQRKRIVELAAKNRLPSMYDAREFAEEGGLMSYGTILADLDRRAATYVDKILKGAKPADLPVEQPMKFEFVINLKTARQIGLTIPPNVLARADRVIK